MKTITKLLGIALIALMLLGCNGQTQQATQDVALEGSRPFITKWQGTAGETLKIPVIGTYTLTWYNEATPNERHTEQVTVSSEIFKKEDEGGSYEYEVAAPYTFTTPTDGTYVVEAGPEGVTGMFMIFDNNGYEFASKLLFVEQFGDVVWKRLSGAFEHCDNMQFAEGIDVPNLSQCTNLSRMFDHCKQFNSPLAHWDVSNVTDMDEMFCYCKVFNQPLESRNVSQVTNMSNMFAVCDLFNQPLGGWDVRNVTNMLGMFQSCERFNQPLEKWNVSDVSDMQFMFFGCAAFNQSLEA